MDCSWDSRLLSEQLPVDLLQIIQHSSDNEQYLEAITKTSLDSRYTYTLLAHCADLFPHICASLRSHASLPACLATIARVVPYAPHLATFATRLLQHEHYNLKASSDEDLLYLLGLFRLLRFEPRLFRKFVRSHELVPLLGKTTPPVTYLIIRILQIDLEAADFWLETTLSRYLGPDSSEGSIDGLWDEKTIDYRFLTLWELDRTENVLQLIASARSANSESQISSTTMRTIPRECFHPSTSVVGGVLLSTEDSEFPEPHDLIETETVRENLASLAKALRSSSPTLLLGLPGAGKSLLVRHAARALGKLDKLVTLHLNEQSDAKLLLGVYTTGDTPGSFIWKPGVLTTAVQEGRWVLIEDLDRAPNDVLGTLLPIIEKRQLLIPNRKETIVAAEGFRILATVRTSLNHRGEETKPLTHMVGYRHWNTVQIGMPSAIEQSAIAKSLFPKLEQLMPQFINVYERLSAARQQIVGQSKTGVARPTSPRDLLKWCRRVSLLMNGRSSFTSQDEDAMFLEALDCFLGALPNDALRTSLAAVVAEELRIDPQRRDYLLSAREVPYEADKGKITIGRYSLPKTRNAKAAESSFSTNPHTTRMLERVTSAVLNREPLLLVGETGVGKTTAVQHLANHLGKKLVPFNLSQQSEAGDLLGGFKPVNARTLMIPLKDEFDDLFAEGFSLKKNRQFIDVVGQQVAKGNWKYVCKLFRQAVGMVDEQRAVSPPSRHGEAPAKKRKTETKRHINFARWDAFVQTLEDVERKLSHGSTFAFTFVEGNIVKALRNGDWVLLDEINLASSDTLETIADLLDHQSPSLLLTEAGNIERIEAHPEFRVFAAMNPATDVGKKDLPPGIRSRFTELYVESPDKDFKSLQSIVRAYLRQGAVSDAAISSDVSHLYQKIIALAEDNKLVDGAGQKPHFSLRTLTRTLSYAREIQQQCSLRRALYEGFHMSFMTFLDAESAIVVQPFIEQYLFGKRVNVRAELQKALRKPDDGRAYVQGYPGSKHWIRQGREQVQEQPHYIITPFVQRNLENLVRATSTRKFPVLIQGPTSSGKTSMIEYLAKRTGHVFTRINNHEHTDLQEYLGTYVSGTDGQLHFQEGVLVRALREGHWIVLDELNLAPTDVLEALNRLLDDNRELLIPETQEVIRPHHDFMLFATQNPAGLYGGRKTLSRAFRNRFLELHFDDIPVSELQEILHRRTQLPESRCRRIVNVYKELSLLRQENRLFEQKSFATLRDLFRWALRPNDTIEQLAANGFMLLAERVRKPEEQVALKAVIENVMSEKGPRVRVNEDELYAKGCGEIDQHNREATARGVVWTKAMRRLYVLVSRAVANNEPVLLVGETGCGKTTVCQMLADALGQKLHTLNAHQNTETSDLIGSQRPVRNRAAIESDLRQKLLASPALQTLDGAQSLPTEVLLDAYVRAVSELAEDQKAAWLQGSVHSAIQAARVRFKALFEWVDGSLVQAMKNGEFFLLDEISLADDSTLERINSVLESSRTIMLAEKGSLDSFVTASPSFQFFATMNPGGDYGKRELSPALRNRFTEIWVPSITDVDDVLQIVEAKLTQAAHSFATSMVSFAAWFKARFDTSASLSISVRDILAWVEFVNAFSEQDVTAAVVHGAAMVYIDTLGANPAGLMTINLQNLGEERSACLDQLSRLLDQDSKAIYERPLQAHSTESTFTIGPFAIPRMHAVASRDSGFTFEPPTTRLNAMRVLRALQLRKPILLEGSPGVGKTALVTAVASAAGMPLTRINLSDQTDLLDLFGSDAPVEGAETGTFVWRDAPFLRAMKNGEWVLLDEMNLASQSVLEGLNACLDHRGEVFVPELGQTFSRHPDFRLFAAQNPHHQGGGRKGLPSSFVNRFTVVYADSFKSDDLMLICRRMFSTLPEDYIANVVEFVSKLNYEVADRRSFGANGGPWEFNLRDIARWLGLAAADEGLLKSGGPRDFATMLCSQRFRSAFDRHQVEELFESVFAETNVADLFLGILPRTLQVGLASLPRDEVWAPSRPLQEDCARQASRQNRLLQSLALSVQRSWPLVLAGPSGAGKTTMIERLAAAVGADLVTLGMSAETDALDLIGGYEQVDPNRQFTQALHMICTHVEALCKTNLTQASSASAITMLECLHQLQASPTNVVILDRLASTLPTEAKTKLRPSFETLAHGNREVDKARFEWIDGPLIEALQQGEWLVLDNANLCSPSVLDRLNSLLEPNGALIVNEHCGEDGSPRIIEPHANFRIFLTVDPRLGELSRAMRNRAVELYLDGASTEACSSTDGLFAESAMARFLAVKSAGLVRSEVGDDNALSIVVDHFAVDDRMLAPRMIRQLEIGLLQPAVGAARDAAALRLSEQVLKDMLSNLYDSISSHRQAPADFACVQTLHPLNNQPLVQHARQSFSFAMTLAAQHDLGTDLKVISTAFAKLKADRKLSERVTRFWRSVRQHVNGARGATSLWHPLDAIILSLQKLVAAALPDAALSQIKTVVRGLMAFVQTLLQVLTSETLEMSTFTACMLVGQSMGGHGLIPDAQSHLEKVQTSISELVPKSQTNSGYGMVSIWKTFKPSTPATMNQLEAVLDFEALIDRFDRLSSTFRLPLQRLVELRSAFQRALNVGATASSDLSGLAQALVASTPELTAGDKEIEESLTLPHFAQSFELMSQQFAILSLSRPCLSQPEAVSMELLASRRTTDGLNSIEEITRTSPQHQLRLLGLSMPRGGAPTDNAPAEAVYKNILRDLATVDAVSLDTMALFEAETDAISKIVASKAQLLDADNLPALDACLRVLVTSLLQSLENGVDTSYPKEYISLLRRAREENIAFDAEQVPGLDAEYHATVGLLQDAVKYLQGNLDQVKQPSRAWASFALAGLEMFVPELAFDPVQESEFRREVFFQAKNGLQTKLSALQAFREAWTGSRDSLRGRVIEQDIADLGSAPPSEQICRPKVSQLAQLFGEFNALRRSLQALKSSISGNLEFGGWDNVLVIRSRLSTQYRAYQDLSSPVVGFIDCLAIARRLHDQTESPTDAQAALSRAAITPFVGSGKRQFLSDENFLVAQQTCTTRDTQLFWLSSLAIRSSVIPIREVSRELLVALQDTFRGFYEAWKVELSREQRHAAANSSLYKYRGGDDDQDEVSQQELDELFPGYDEEARDTHNNSHGTQDLAPKMAELFHAIHSPTEPRSEQFTQLLGLWAASPGSSPHQEHVPTVLCALGDLSTRLSSEEVNSRTANIYKDANVAQSRKLVVLLQNIRSRFSSIHDTWPEHATPIEVLRCCDLILTLGHAEPLVRYLPHLEKLHATINEWQKVASSEFSANILLEETTSLIIAWRQLELSTWAGMFNFEDEQCRRAASSWWYIAYETIICASEAEDSMTGRFISQLVDTLGGFLANCGLGEFSLRLSMLADFEAAVAAHASAENLKPIRGVLSSLNSFYARFESTVTQQLAKKRAELEKNIKNVVQVASWKDRNIETLKTSAKASHKKLFRTVKKYRQLLAEPVGPILQAEFPKALATGNVSSLLQPLSNVTAKSSSLPVDTSGQPARSHDTEEIAQRIEATTESLSLSSKSAKKVERFLENLNEESNELRKATPSIATDKNKNLVQHLKTRKRRLLADVLRDIRSMGFQTNISEGVLAQQSSLHAVLASSPPLGEQLADEQFHRLLYVMQSVRESAVKHSEDLTPAEIARAKTLLESMLQVSVEQRDTLQTSLQGFATLTSAIEQLAALSCAVEPSIDLKSVRPLQALLTEIRAVRQALQTAVHCVGVQAKFARKDYSIVLNAFVGQAGQLEALSSEAMQVQSMPPHTTDSESRTLTDKVTAVLDQASSTATNAMNAHPELQPVLAQLLKWTTRSPLSSADAGGAQTAGSDSCSSSLNELLEQVQQRTENVQVGIDVVKNKKSWLLTENSSVVSTISALGINTIANDLSKWSMDLHSDVNSDKDLAHVAKHIATVYPILHAYAEMSRRLITDLCSLHTVTCRMGHRLALSFVQLARQGFCQPPENEQDENKQSGQVESGTGLGDGEGAEDISKDVGDDEDLGELAQEPNSKEKDGETEAEKDAVDMADEELEGEFDESPEGGDENEGEESGQEDGNLEEEAGKVDEKDGATDEKTWDDGKAEDADKEADQSKGTRSEDISASAEEASKDNEQQNNEQQDLADGEQEGQDADTGPEMEDETDHQIPDQADPHLQEEQNLELPDDLNMDGGALDDDQPESDSDLGDDLNDVDADDANAEPEPADGKDIDMAEEENEDDQGQDNGEAADPEQDTEEPNEDQADDAASDVKMLDMPDIEDQPNDGITSADAGQGHEEDNAAQPSNALSKDEQIEDSNDAQQDNEQPGTSEGQKRSQQNDSSGQVEVGEDEQQAQAYKQLGDLLEQWYEQHRDIEAAKDDEQPGPQQEAEMQNTRFEHTQDIDAEMQALGAASADQSRALDNQNAVAMDNEEPDNAEKLDNTEQPAPEERTTEDNPEAGSANEGGADAKSKPEKALIGPPADTKMELEAPDTTDSPQTDMEGVDEQLTNTHLTLERPDLMSMEEARHLYSEHESRTRNMAVVLTEHLRLILQPTQATKMRGDFRTGKRLNIKKIIPYIASSYKRDKIWMRRSIPSKRSYQIMLAIDDSESMNESERKGLAFDTLALVAKSMAMLEVGELCIVGFGETVNVNHDFSAPFTSEAGAHVFQQFSFAQSKTDVRKLLESSIDLFRTARLKASGSASDLWQLQLIISDGLCEDHPTIRQLVRQAHEEQIMVVFIVVDATAQESTAVDTKQSIVDLQRVEFVKDASGEAQIKMIKYLDTFPFRYYLIVRDVVELPAVLAGALRQWFAEVVESGG